MTDSETGERRSPTVDYLIHREVDRALQRDRFNPWPMGQPVPQPRGLKSVGPKRKGQPRAKVPRADGEVCEHPYRAKADPRSKDSAVAYVPCGACLPCRKKLAASWVLRMSREAVDHAASSFLTLTYEDTPGRDFAAFDASYLSDLSRAIDLLRVRRRRAGLPPIRYYRVLEQGEQRGRYHHHLALFGREAESDGHLAEHDWWPHGFVKDSPITLGRMGYVAGYATKALRSAGEVHSSMSLNPGLGLDRLFQDGRHFGRLLLPAGRPQAVPPRIDVRGQSLPLMREARRAFAAGMRSAGCEVVPDAVPWLDPLVARAMTRSQESRDRERNRERAAEDAERARQEARERARFNPAGRL